MAEPLYTIKFDPSEHKPVLAEYGANLAELLTPCNSPVLFGCRAGICGTCLIEVEILNGEVLEPASDEEKAVIDMFYSRNNKVRLACQIRLNADLLIKTVKESGNGS